MATRVETHRDMHVWAPAMDLTESIYCLTQKLPPDERFGLITQMRRAAISVPSNISEGAARGSSADFIRFLMIARGSLSELETQLYLVERLHLGTVEATVYDDVRIIRQMLIALIRSLRKRKL